MQHSFLSVGRQTNHNMQKLTLACLCLVFIPILVASFPWDNERDDFDEGGALRTFNKIERRTWCARWGDYCVPDAKVKFADCCTGLRCVCGKFWSQNKCHCKSNSALG